MRRVEPIVGIAGNVEPEPSPALSELRRGEQSVYDFRKRIGRHIFDESINGLGLRRQSDEIKIGAPDERPLVGWFNGR